MSTKVILTDIWLKVTLSGCELLIKKFHYRDQPSKFGAEIVSTSLSLKLKTMPKHFLN